MSEMSLMHTLLKEESCKCNKCGAEFNPLQSRVPWLGWKDKKIMSDFIHREVIPKVPKKWQDYLLQHWTIIFIASEKSKNRKRLVFLKILYFIEGKLW
jgi:hypothetical protein